MESIVKALHNIPGRTFVICSPSSLLVYNQEMNTEVKSATDMVNHIQKKWNLTSGKHVFDERDFYDIGSDVASGTNSWRGMIITPCSMKTVASVNAGITSNLIERCADVTLKERRRLIIVPREAPFNRIHLKNLLGLDEAGAIIMPASPGFYQRPNTIEDLADFMTAKIFNLLDIEHNLIPKWEG